MPEHRRFTIRQRLIARLVGQDQPSEDLALAHRDAQHIGQASAAQGIGGVGRAEDLPRSVAEAAASIESWPFAAALFDAASRLVALNTVFADAHRLPSSLQERGTSRDDLVRFCCRDGVPPVDGDALARAADADAVIEAQGRLYAARLTQTADGGSLLIHQDITGWVDHLRRGDAMRRDAEQQAREAGVAHDRLREAFETIPEGLVLLDAEDRFVFGNRRYAELYMRGDDRLDCGMTFEAILQIGLSRGEYPDAIGREDAWLAARMARHRLPFNSHEQRTSDGRWVRVDERRTADGGSIGLRTDITELKQREASFKLLFDGNPMPLFVVDRTSSRLLAVNDEMTAAYGFSCAAFLTMTVGDLWPSYTPDTLRALVAMRPGAGHELRSSTHLRADGTAMSVRLFARDLCYDGREATIISVIDVTEITRVEAELTRTRAFLDSVVESIPLTVFVKDMADDGRYVLFNRAGEDLVRTPRSSILGRTDADLFGWEDAERYRRQDLDLMAERQVLAVEEECDYANDGNVRVVLTKKMPVTPPTGEPPRYLLGVQEDVTDRRRIERRLAHMAHHDALTDLPNRTFFRAALEQVVALGGRAAVLWIDLDRFKAVNDGRGHLVGDALLVEVARRIRSALRRSDCAARLGGDEFAVLQSPVGRACETDELVGRLNRLLAAPYDIGGARIDISASIGIARVEGAAYEAEELLRQADLALYAAKSRGRAGHCTFGSDLASQSNAERTLEKDLRLALGEAQFRLHYQPIASMVDGEVTGYEALLRWHHPTRGLLYPHEFLAAAEALGLMVPLGAWVLQTACAEASRWPAHLRLAVNVSPTQVQSGTLTATVAATLAATGLLPARLDLEITETVLMVADHRNAVTLRDLRAHGVGLSLDDFGTGYSSLSHLRNFPVDRIKIDQSFVRDIESSRDCLAIVRAVVGLASSLAIKVVAEGVETVEQFARLKAEGCNEAQGFLIGRPLPSSERLADAQGLDAA